MIDNYCIDSKDALPQKVTLAYGLLTSTLLLLLIVYNYIRLYLNESGFCDKALHSQLLSVMKGVLSQKKCILVALIHLWDQSSDAGVIVLYYIIV